MTKKLEKLADQMINLSPEEGQKLAMIIKAKVMPEQAKQQQQQGLLQQQNPQAQQQMAIMGKRPGGTLKAPSKKVGNKRRASFCARMSGMKKKLTSAKTARDPNSRINKSLRAWNC